MQQSFPVRFKRGIAIGAEFRARFDCGSPPTLAPDGLQPTGTSGFAVIFGHEYLFRDAYISSVKTIQYATSKCNLTTRYQFALEFFVSDQFLLGFSYNGFGAAIPYRCRSRKFRVEFETDEFCCDTLISDQQVSSRNFSIRGLLEKLIPAASVAPFLGLIATLAHTFDTLRLAQILPFGYIDLLTSFGVPAAALLIASTFSALGRPPIDEFQIEDAEEIANR